MTYTRADLLAARSFAIELGDLLIRSTRDPAAAAAAELRRLVGLLPFAVDTWGLGGSDRTELLACFRAAGNAGASATDMNVVRATVQAGAGDGLEGILRLAAVRYALAQMARALSRTDFASRNDVSAAQALADRAFQEAEDYAAGTSDFDTGRALVALHAAVTRDLAVRGRLLPQVVTYSLPRSLPAVILAQRFFGAADRQDELVSENQVIHPLFMPIRVTALSA